MQLQSLFRDAVLVVLMSAVASCDSVSGTLDGEIADAGSSNEATSSSDGSKAKDLTVDDDRDASIPPAGDAKPPPTQTASSVGQYGITWRFAQEYVVGRFATGDWYVVDPGSGVEIDSITPAYRDGRNGSEVNPTIANGSPYYQSWDSSSVNAPYMLFSADNVFQSGLLHAGDSLVSAISRTDQQAIDADPWGTKRGNIWTTAVLTVLSSSPATLAFRPPYAGTDKPLYYVKDVQAHLLPNLDRGVLRAASPDHRSQQGGLGAVEYLERMFERPQTMLHGHDWVARGFTPGGNAADYWGELCLYYSEALVLLMTDWTGLDRTNKSHLLYALIQAGIDAFQAVKHGSGSSQISAAHTWFAGLMLNDSAMRDYWRNATEIVQRLPEKAYYADSPPNTPVYSSSIVPEGQTWVGWKVPAYGRQPGRYVAFSKKCREDGHYCYEHLHPSEWSCDDGTSARYHCYNEIYRSQEDSGAFVGMALAAHILDRYTSIDVPGLWDCDACVDYMDRWMGEDFTTAEYGSSGRTFYEEMLLHTDFTQYPGYGVAGTAGVSSNSFVTEMWRAYRR